MKTVPCILLVFVLASSACVAGNGIITRPSTFSVDETVSRLDSVLNEKGMTVFAHIDHGSEAAKAGMTLRPTVLVIFGNPKAGTVLMQASPTAAIDLPLKVLVWQDEDGKVWVSYNSPAYIREPEEVTKNISAIGSVIDRALK